MDPDKVKEVLDWKQPMSVSEVRSFLGLVGNYPFLGFEGSF
jgi:hypothetical protein